MQATSLFNKVLDKNQIMSLILRGLYGCESKLATRSLSSTPVFNIQRWREERGLPVNKNAEGILTDGPDYTFLDGRPTPLLQKQKLRMMQNQGYAQKIVQLSSELDFAKRRQQDMLQAKEQERENIRKNWLKPKGRLYNKNTHRAACILAGVIKTLIAAKQIQRRIA